MKSLNFLKPTLPIVLALLLSVRPGQAGYTVTLQQVGSDVVANGSGPIDLAGLSFFGHTTRPTREHGMAAMAALIFTGQTGVFTDLYTGFSGPTSFGSGFEFVANTGSGDFVGMFGAREVLFLPRHYVSNTALSDSMMFNNATFISLGVRPGTYVWTSGTGANQNFTLIIPGVGVPDSGSTLGLLLVPVSGLFGLSRFRCLRLV